MHRLVPVSGSVRRRLLALCSAALMASPTAAARARHAIAVDDPPGAMAGAQDSPRIRELGARLDSTRKQVERLELESQLRRRRFPPSFDATEAERELRALARTAGLDPREIRPVAGPEPAPSPGDLSFVELHPVEVLGEGELRSLELFLSRLSSRARLTVVESVALAAAANGGVAYEARILLPTVGEIVRPLPGGRARPREALPSASDDPERAVEARVAAVYLEELERLENDARFLSTMIAALGELATRAELAPGLRPLARLELEIGDEAIALRAARVADEMILEGVTLGARARSRLRSALRSAGIEAGDLRETAMGECLAFTVRATSIPDLASSEQGVGDRLFEARLEQTCRPEPTEFRGEIATGREDPRDGGGFRLRLRDVEVADVFRALHELLGVSFVVDSDLGGRVSVEIDERSSFEELRKLGVIVGSGPLHRVRLDGIAPAPEQPPAGGWTGEPASFRFRHGDVREIFCLFGGILPVEIRVPRAAAGEVSVFAAEIPVDQMFDALAVSAGLRTRREEGRWTLGTAGGGAPAEAVDPCALIDGAERRSRLPGALALDRLGVDDLRIAGAARLEGTWMAFAEGPGRSFWTLEVGTLLFGSRVVGIGAKGVEFETDAGQQVELAW